MAWSNRDFDPQVLSAALLSAAQQVLSKASAMAQSQDPKVEATDIVNYEGRMRALGLEKLNSTCYVSVVNFYLNQGEMERRGKPKGAFVLYMETENAGKFFKALEIKFSDDEDDATMISACGQFTKIITDGLINELSSRGYATLVPSAPRNYKNSVLEGVEYSSDQKTKHEIGFFYFKRKTIAVELTLAPIPKK